MTEQDTRISYDTVASSYADLVRDALDREPFLRASVATFADLIHAAGGGPVVDIGCGPGHVTAHLHKLGIDAFGIDLSPGMIAQARQDHPALRFEVGSMTALHLPDASVAGVLAWWSLIHVSDNDVPKALTQFARILRPGGLLQIGFHVGDDTRMKTGGYGGHPMKLPVHRRQPAQLTKWLKAAGFTLRAEMLLDLDGNHPGAILYAHR